MNQNLRLLYDYDVKFEIKRDYNGSEIGGSFERVDELWRRADLDNDLTKDVLAHLHQSQETFIKAHYDGKSVSKKLTPSRGFISGVGEVSVYDVGFKFHHLFGIPFIPASGWQGVIRHWILRMAYKPQFDKDHAGCKTLEQYAEKDPAFVFLFGNTDKKGNITFLDAYPVELKQDNIKPNAGKTPHHGDYYTKGTAPTDDKSPVPIPMLAVKGVTFKLNMVNEGRYGDWTTAIENSILKKAEGANNPLTLLEKQLPNLFRYFGVGSNTHNDYGKGNITD